MKDLKHRIASWLSETAKVHFFGRLFKELWKNVKTFLTLKDDLEVGNIICSIR